MNNSSHTVGVTTTLPDTVPHDLPDSDAGPHEWNYWDRSLFHNEKERKFPDLPPLNDLTRGQTVGLLVTTNGRLHLFLDGQHRNDIATGLPVDTPLWRAASVYGNCTKIKSEILSGESGGVDYVRMGEHEAVSCTYQKREHSVMLIIIIILMQLISLYIECSPHR